MDNTDEKCGCNGAGHGEENCCGHGKNECGCGHDHDHEENATVTLTLDDDTELECSILGTFDIEDAEYIVLLPIDDEEVLIYRYDHVGEEVTLGLIESDEEFELVSETFYSIFGKDDFEIGTDSVESDEYIEFEHEHGFEDDEESRNI